MRDAHAIASPEAAQLGELTETVALTPAEISDHAVGDLGRHPVGPSVTRRTTLVAGFNQFERIG
jgi:hypothetical protein